MKFKSKIFILLFVFVILIPNKFALAHQPRVVEGEKIAVTDPEVSKAYYGTLSGEPHTYIINSPTDFNLYVGILVPATKNSQKDVKAVVYKNDIEIASVGGENANWKSFFEPFGQSYYWDGGEYKSKVSKGEYKVVVTSLKNDSKYSLAIGEIEAFDMKEGLSAINIIPQLKKSFFEESPISFIKSVFGWGYILAIYILSFVFGFIFRIIVKKISLNPNRKLSKNIGVNDKILRFIISVGLLVWAISTSWSPILIFFSGFALFETFFSWCGFYALLGKNTCPL